MENHFTGHEIYLHSKEYGLNFPEEEGSISHKEEEGA